MHDLQRYHPDFAIAVVDQVMEDIRIGMEVSCFRLYLTDSQENIFKFNQRRIASIKFLGELYMYRVVNAAVIFDVLWSLLSFGHRELATWYDPNSQPRACLFPGATARSTLSATSSVSDWRAPCSTRAASASARAHCAASWTSTSSFCR